MWGRVALGVGVWGAREQVWVLSCVVWGRLAVGVVQGSSRGGADSRRQGLGV